MMAAAPQQAALLPPRQQWQQLQLLLVALLAASSAQVVYGQTRKRGQAASFADLAIESSRCMGVLDGLITNELSAHACIMPPLIALAAARHALGPMTCRLPQPPADNRHKPGGLAGDGQHKQRHQPHCQLLVRLHRHRVRELHQHRLGASDGHLLSNELQCQSDDNHHKPSSLAELHVHSQRRDLHSRLPARLHGLGDFHLLAWRLDDRNWDLRSKQ